MSVAEHSDEYLAYMISDSWQLQRMAALARADYKCAQCPAQSTLEVHHLTYERLGHEIPGDLQVLCLRHHKAAHKRSDAQALYEARINGWCRKRWGDDWEADFGWDEGADQFERWLERMES